MRVDRQDQSWDVEMRRLTDVVLGRRQSLSSWLMCVRLLRPRLASGDHRHPPSAHDAPRSDAREGRSLRARPAVPSRPIRSLRR